MKQIKLLLLLVLSLFLFSCNGEEKEDLHVEEFTVNFIMEGGSPKAADQTILKNEVVIKPNDPEKEGYEFIGWYLNDVLYDFNLPVTKDLRLTAKWEEVIIEPLEFTVTFDALGGSATEDIIVAENEKVTKPKDPEKEGYKFVGWYLNDVLYDFNLSVTKSFTLTAKWEKEEDPEITHMYYFVCFVDVDLNNIYEPVEIKENEQVTKPNNPTKEGFEFVGWHLNDVLYDFNLPVTKDLRLTAKWEEVIIEPLEFTVTFNTLGGSVIDDVIVTEGEKVTKPNNPTKEGYKFVGWYLNDVLYDFTLPVTKDLTLTAQWEEVIIEPLEFTVTFDTLGGSVIDDVIVTEGEKVTKPNNPTKEGFEFVGWFLNDSEYSFDLPVTKNITLKAEWYELVKEQFTITFDSKGGSEVLSITDFIDSSINKPNNPTKEDYRFAGWINKETKEAISWPVLLIEDLTLEAVWNEAVPLDEYLDLLLNNYKFDPQEILPEKMRAGGKITSKTGLNKDYNGYVNINDIVYEGYGEQWQMVLDNLEQAEIFFNLLGAIETVSSLSVIAYNNYLDSNPSNTNKFEFNALDGKYEVGIYFDGEFLIYLVSYTATLPALGTQTVQIALMHNVLTNHRLGRIQIGNANALKYEIFEDSYVISSKYLGLRTSYLKVEEHEGGIIFGQLYEHTTVSSVSLKSAAEFYIYHNSLVVVGNKAGAMLGFEGTIVELYSIDTGTLLAYEVEEKRLGITFNTLWFNLNMTSGLNTIKAVETEGSFDPSKNNHEIYVNGNSNIFKTKNFGGISGKMLSRRYDIEFRTQYVYILEDGKPVKKETSVPMIFIQAEKYDELETDLMAQNAYITSFELNVPLETKIEIEDKYEALIPIFETHKDLVNAEDIEEFIGDMITIS